MLRSMLVGTAILVGVILTAPAGAQLCQPCVPPLDSSYLGQFHARYPIGVLIRNPAHCRFTNCLPTPPPGAPAQTHVFGSVVFFEVSFDGGQTFQRHRAEARVRVKVKNTTQGELGDVQTFTTEMLSMDIRGGTLPPNVVIRESPTQKSRGKMTVWRNPCDTQCHIESFFDVFTELSIDGGQSFQPSDVKGRMVLTRPAP